MFLNGKSQQKHGAKFTKNVEQMLFAACAQTFEVDFATNFWCQNEWLDK